MWKPNEQDFIKSFVDLIIERVMSAIDMASIPSPEAVTASAKSLAKKAVLDHIKRQLAADVSQLNIRTALTNYIESRVADAKENLTQKQDGLKKAREDYEQQLESIAAADEAARRIYACEPAIYRMLPYGEGTYENQQCLRSRALVIASLAGMTHYGFAQPANPEASKRKGDPCGSQ